jgi:hypothetical protein
MRKLLVECAAIALGLGALCPIQAQSGSPPSAASLPPAASIPEQGDRVTTTGQLAGPVASPADLTGKMVYTKKGRVIGRIVFMSRGAHGEQVAVVHIEEFYGIRGRYLLFPVTSLSPKSGLSYATSLSVSQIKGLSETQSQTP